LRVTVNYLTGAALALYRFTRAFSEAPRLKRLSQQFEAQHLAHLTAYPDRASLVASLPRDACVAEVGVARGTFSRTIIDIAAPRKLFLIDYWQSGKSGHGWTPLSDRRWSGRRETDLETVQRDLAAEINSGTVLLRRGYSWEQIGALADESLDWVYLDAGHDYDSVVKDLEAVLPKLKPGGTIAGHDFVRWGRFGYRCGVVEAVTQFCVQQDFALTGLTFEGAYPPSFAIRSLDSL